MKLTHLSILLILTIFFAAARADQFFDGDLWSKYRVALIQILQSQFPALADGLNIGKSTFHVVATPEEAAWHQDRFDLNENFAKYAIKHDATFDYIGTTSDHEVPRLYERMIMKCNNPQAFQKFRSAQTEAYPSHGVTKSYPWHETKTTLASFVAQTSGKPDGSVRFIVESSKGQTSINSPWEQTTGPIVHAGSFVKDFKSGTDDDDLLDMDLSGDDDTFLFRRSRRAPTPVPITTITVKSEKFKVDFQAKGLQGITIAPGAWFDKTFIAQNAGNLQEFFGKGGKMPIIPKIVWVAQNPHVVVELSESEWQKFQHSWNSPSTVGMSIGGTFFRTSHFKQKMTDDDDVKESAKAFYLNEDNAPFHADVATFTVVNADDDVAVVMDEQTAEADDHTDLLTMNDDINTDEDTFLFRRRRRSPPPPPPPPVIVHEKVYRAEFRSTDPRPQIIAVTGEILP
uniref:Phospholipase B-like n=1 Tax=Percolomonas cosmopolitus TaxID=63605 RepID=A0A7S1KNB6_9EUKA